MLGPERDEETKEEHTVRLVLAQPTSGAMPHRDIDGGIAGDAVGRTPWQARRTGEHIESIAAVRAREMPI